MLPSCRSRPRRLAWLLLPCLAALLAGCGTLAYEQPVLEGEQAVDAARFYWPYAALAANVYTTGGAIDRDAAMIAGSPWLREEIGASGDSDAQRRQWRALADKTRSILDSVTNDCLQSAPPVPPGAKGPPERTGVCRNAQRSDPIGRAPTSDAECSARSGWTPPVALDAVREEQRWEPVPELQRELQPRGWSVFVPGLAIDVWRRPREAEDGAPTFEYAIVYRGTEGTGGWLSNFRPLAAFTPLVWDQYHQALQATADLVRQIHRLHAVSDDILERKRPTRVLITAVGHSLGGGLANYVLLRVPEITRVVNFNPSPIDGASLFSPDEPSAAEQAGGRERSRAWVDSHRSEPYDGDTRAPGAAIYSLYEKGEALTTLVGCPSGALWGSEGGPVRLCEAVDLSHNGVLHQHDINQLACRLYLKSREQVAGD